MVTVPASRSRRWPRIILLLFLVGVLAQIGWIVSQVKNDHWDRVARARFYLDRGQPDRAIEAVSSIRDEGPGAAEGLTIAASAFLMRGEISMARRALERSLRMKHDQPETAKMLAAICLAAGDGRRGIALLKEAARLEPGDYRPWYAMGKVYHDMGNLEESAEAYAQTLCRIPPAAESKEAHLGRVRALLDAKQAARVSADLDELKRQEPDDPQVLSLSARQARDLGRLDEAQELADRALAGEPSNFDALLVRAGLHFLARRPTLVIVDLERAVRIKPHDVAALQMLGQAQRILGLTQEAAATQERADRSRDRIMLMDQLTKVIDRRPDDPEPRWRMGQTAMDGELYVLAYQCFQAALDIDPGYQPARDALAKLRRREGFDPQSVVSSPMQIMGKRQSSRP